MEIALIACFVIGYLAITLEHKLKLDKAAIALLTGVGCWTIFAIGGDQTQHQGLESGLAHHLSEVASILFFLLGAMTIVQLMDDYHAFDQLAKIINIKNKRIFIWQVSWMTFFISSALDNLTTTIIMVTLVGKIVADRDYRLYVVGMIIIAANAGGAWSPIGDVTTTMLWMGKQIDAITVIKDLLLPSIVCTVVPLLALWPKTNGPLDIQTSVKDPEAKSYSVSRQRLMFFVGLSGLLFVPIFKTVTHLPPYMGMMGALAIIWLVTALISKRDDRSEQKEAVHQALERIDTPTIFFFFGILISVAALQQAGILLEVGKWLDLHIANPQFINVLIGFFSAIFDNVPLVAAIQNMYSLNQFPTNDPYWTLLAYTAGTGGSMLIIGSAAGVAAMGIERISFGEYLRKISWLALIGYLAGVGVFWVLN
jgi:Na+/H+ antiporter NhaD/arsenite permease-like protein